MPGSALSCTTWTISSQWHPPLRGVPAGPQYAGLSMQEAGGTYGTPQEGWSHNLHYFLRNPGRHCSWRASPSRGEAITVKDASPGVGRKESLPAQAAGVANWTTHPRLQSGTTRAFLPPQATWSSPRHQHKVGWGEHIRLNRTCRADIAWWKEFLEQWNGKAFLCPPASLPTVELVSDASGSWGCGGVAWEQLVPSSVGQESRQNFYYRERTAPHSSHLCDVGPRLAHPPGEMPVWQPSDSCSPPVQIKQGPESHAPAQMPRFCGGPVGVFPSRVVHKHPCQSFSWWFVP